MKFHLITATAFLSVAGLAQAQTATPTPAPASPPPTAPANDLTRNLNSGPPVPAVYIAPVPTPVVAPSPPAASPGTAAPAPIVRPATGASPNPLASAPVLPPAVATPPRVVPIPSTPAPQPRPAPLTSPSATPTAVPQPPAPAPAPVPPPPGVSTITVLDAATRAALPFSVTLPAGFEIVTGRPGPDFRIYTIRRGEQSFVMVYAGPASQFPIYSGPMVEAGGRASIVSTEDGVRHAMEHLFQRPDAPREVHVWTMSLDGGDRVLAEQIAQSVDIR